MFDKLLCLFIQLEFESFYNIYLSLEFIYCLISNFQLIILWDIFFWYISKYEFKTTFYLGDKVAIIIRFFFYIFILYSLMMFFEYTVTKFFLIYLNKLQPLNSLLSLSAYTLVIRFIFLFLKKSEWLSIYGIAMEYLFIY